MSHNHKCEVKKIEIKESLTVKLDFIKLPNMKYLFLKTYNLFNLQL